MTTRTDWFSMVAEKLLGMGASAMVAFVGTGLMQGVSLLTVTTTLVYAVCGFFLFTHVLTALPGVLREVFVVAVAVLSGIVGAGWCLGHEADCIELSDTAVTRTARIVNATATFVTRLWEDVTT